MSGNREHSEGGTCPVMHGSDKTAVVLKMSNHLWWPNQMNIRVLHQNAPLADPMGEHFDYAEEFKKLDLAALKRDLFALMTESQEWWPADYGHYGPFFIRMAWHSAGTYRTSGRARWGSAADTQRFRAVEQLAGQRQPRQGAAAALADQAEIRQRKLSWADLYHPRPAMCALESMGFKTFGFGGGRPRHLGARGGHCSGVPEGLLARRRAGIAASGELAHSALGAVQMGLIYVNPEGPNGTA